MNKEQRLQNRIKSLEKKLDCVEKHYAMTCRELIKVPKWIRKLFGVKY